VNADPAIQLRLLDLQSLDSRLDGLAARRERLPVLAELDALATEHRRLTDEVRVTKREVDQLTREQDRAEAEVESVRARRERDQRRLDAGQVATAKELQALQSEVESLIRRQSDLEEQELVVMQQLEDAQHRLVELEAAQAEVAANGRAARTSRDNAWQEIDGEVATVREQRDKLAADIPAPLRELYEKLRVQMPGGVAVAALQRGRCGGCRLDLAPSDLARLRAAPADEVVRCEECRRILVRIPESGL
jgi:predicted  nucleic acid-binding Zn-ribbon protein